MMSDQCMGGTEWIDGNKQYEQKVCEDCGNPMVLLPETGNCELFDSPSRSVWICSNCSTDTVTGQLGG